jgi:hypothetical protein
VACPLIRSKLLAQAGCRSAVVVAWSEGGRQLAQYMLEDIAVDHLARRRVRSAADRRPGESFGVGVRATPAYNP